MTREGKDVEIIPYYKGKFWEECIALSAAKESINAMYTLVKDGRVSLEDIHEELDTQCKEAKRAIGAILDLRHTDNRRDAGRLFAIAYAKYNPLYKAWDKTNLAEMEDNILPVLKNLASYSQAFIDLTRLDK